MSKVSWAIFGHLMLFLVSASSLDAQDRYVDKGSPSPTPPFTTINTAAHTIQEAIDEAKDGDRVIVGSGTYNENILIDSKNVRLYNSNFGCTRLVTIDGLGRGHVVEFRKTTNINLCGIQGFVIRNGSSTNGGGILVDRAHARIGWNDIVHNGAEDGAGVYAFKSNVVFEENNFENNRAISKGGALSIFGPDSRVRILDNMFLNNLTEEDGGGAIRIASVNEPIIMERNKLENNEAARMRTHAMLNPNIVEGGGGAVFLVQAEIRANSNDYVSNRAAGSGGALAFYRNAAIRSTSEQYFNNFTRGNGGAVYETVLSTASFQDALFVANTAGGRGGGLRVSCISDITLRGVSVTANSATGVTAGVPKRGSAGGIAVTDSAILITGGCLVDLNQASAGPGGGILVESEVNTGLGAACNNGKPRISLIGATVFLNSCTGNGGGTLFRREGRARGISWIVRDCGIILNFGGGLGFAGGMALEDGDLNLGTPNTVVDNVISLNGEIGVQVIDSQNLKRHFLDHNDISFQTINVQVVGSRVLAMRGNSITQSSQTGVEILDARPELALNSIGHNGGAAVRCSNGSLPTIRENDFFQSTWGVQIDSTSSVANFAFNNFDQVILLGVEKPTPPLQVARFNWWGDASGPTHPSNPAGNGVGVSDNVDFVPFFTAPVPRP